MKHLADKAKLYRCVFLAIVKNSVDRELYYKANFFIRIATDLVWYILNLVFFQVIYMNSNGLGGWSLYDVIFFMGNVFIVDSLNMVFFYPNIMNIPGLVRSGELDNILLLPVNSRFFISLRKINISSLVNAGFGVLLVLYAGIKMNTEIHLLKIPVYLMLLANGVLLMYSILFIAATLSIYVKKSDGLITSLFDLFNLGMKPESIYGSLFRRIITYAFPLLVMVNFPVLYMIKTLLLLDIFWSVAVTAVLFLFSGWFWKTSLKKYNSATS